MLNLYLLAIMKILIVEHVRVCQEINTLQKLMHF